MICSISGCGGRVEAKGLCDKHRTRLRRHGDPTILKTREKGTGSIDSRGAIIFEVNGKRKSEYVLAVERAIGHALKAGQVVHHADSNPANNANSNLVVCPDNAYHRLLHKRMNALAACGNANWVKCKVCHHYDDEANLSIGAGGRYHKTCWARYARERKEKRGLGLPVMAAI